MMKKKILHLTLSGLFLFGTTIPAFSQTYLRSYECEEALEEYTEEAEELKEATISLAECAAKKDYDNCCMSQYVQTKYAYEEYKEAIEEIKEECEE